MMEFLIGVAVGIGAGWVLFEKPEWARNAWDGIRNRITNIRS